MSVLMLFSISCETTKSKEYVFIYPEMPELIEPVFPLDPDDPNLIFEVYKDGYVAISFIDTNECAILPINFLEELARYNTDVRRYINDYETIKAKYKSESEE